MSIFSKVAMTKPRSNVFDLSHDRKFSMDFGHITPIAVIDCIPGDKFQMSTSQMIRFAPMVAPLYHQISVYTHFFFVPNRLVWDNWEKFITGGEDGLDNSVFPTTTTPGNSEGGLTDYLGLPVGTNWPADIQVSAIPYAGYNKIFNEYYRDQNLQTEVLDKVVDGPNNNTGIFSIQIRAWQHDYFTSALPWTQKGPEATIPLGETADINFIGGQTNRILKNNAPFSSTTWTSLGGQANATSEFEAPLSLDESGAVSTASLDNTNSLQVDLSSATSATINDLRNAFRLQEWLEKNARGGSRYNESIMVHFGVNSGDARLNRPEYLGGGMSPVQISEVLQTSNSAFSEGNLQPTTPTGNMSGHGISVGANNSFRYSVKEHGYIFGLMTIMPKSGYQQGIPRHFRKFDKFDYYWPSFANLGEQPVYNYEIYNDDDGLNDETFGYLPRYAEYKYIPSSTHGEFRSSLDYWHVNRIFDNRPNLNEDFIKMRPTNVDRIFAVTDPTVSKLYCYVRNNIKARRPMPYFGTPKGV